MEISKIFGWVEKIPNVNKSLSTIVTVGVSFSAVHITSFLEKHEAMKVSNCCLEAIWKQCLQGAK